MDESEYRKVSSWDLDELMWESGCFEPHNSMKLSALCDKFASTNLFSRSRSVGGRSCVLDNVDLMQDPVPTSYI